MRLHYRAYQTALCSTSAVFCFPDKIISACASFVRLWLRPEASLCFLLPICVMVTSRQVFGCAIPVFQYALDRWAPDCYQVLVFHDGPLASHDQAVVDWLKSLSTAKAANYDVRTLDLATPLDESLQALWASQPSPKTPWMIVRYPRRPPEHAVVWSVPLSAANARRLVDSPARREIAKRILADHSAVWVLLESGDAKQDARAAKLLETQLKKSQQPLTATLRMQDDLAPPEDEQTGDWDGAILFSWLRVSRKEQAEAMLVSTLLASEPDLRELAGPQAFPVFGRGRVLYALVNRGINSNNIAEACAFLVTGCSCVVKAENPGTDLLTSVNWEDVLSQRSVAEPELPPLTGVPESLTASASGSVYDTTPTTGLEPKRSSTLLRNILLAVAVGLAVAAAATLAIKRKPR